jgi:YesN/AraC family two-component response regulator
LNNNLSVYDIAHELKTNKSYISFSINNILKKNFRNFVNEYRIQEAQKLLLDPKFDNLSIEGIAQTVGYISKSTFNTSFQKYTGKKPSDFRNEGKLNS